MTREEIIRALRCCSRSTEEDTCLYCPVYKKNGPWPGDFCEKMYKEAADLLEAQGREAPSSTASRSPFPRGKAEPLTLEELREMDGEPVWIVEEPDWGHWELSEDAEDYFVDRDEDFYGMKHDDPAGRFGLHLLGWLAYRRRPEEAKK